VVSETVVFPGGWSLIQTIINGYKLAFTYPVIMIFIPIIVADILTNECESGIMLMLTSYPTKRSEILISKFLSVFSVSWIVIFSVSLAGVLVAYRNYVMLPPVVLVLALLVSTGVMSFVVCSVSTVISSVARRTVVAAMSSLTVLLLWPIIANAFSWLLKLPNLMILSYTAAVPELIEFWALEWEQPGVPMSSIALVVAQLFLASLFLLLSHIAFSRKEFK
jgi:ABC-type transport system involved in multi-copper enzyme maturation permease subunit